MKPEKQNLYSHALQILSDGITMGTPQIKIVHGRGVLTIEKVLASAKKCFWNVTESYCGKTYAGNNDVINNRKLKTVRKLETKGTMLRKQLTVNINGVESVYILGKKNEYYFNSISLTATLETLSKSQGNKISIK